MKSALLKRLFLFSAPGLLAAACALAQDTFYLRLEATGQDYGPFEYRAGAEVPLGRAVFTLWPVEPEVEEEAETQEAPAAVSLDPGERRDITGYDGIRFGDSTEQALRALLWLPGVDKDDLGAPLFRKARGAPHHQYRVFRSPDGLSEQSDVLVIFDASGVEMIQDTFSGEWMWDHAATLREFERKKQQWIRRWGPPTEELPDYVEWIRPSGLGALRLDEPEKPGDLPVLKLGVRRK